MEIGTDAITAFFFDVNELLEVIGFCKPVRGEFHFS